jgi:hypothetical protein
MGNIKKILEICKLENGKWPEWPEWTPKRKEKKENTRKSLGDYDVSRQEVEADGETEYKGRIALWIEGISQDNKSRCRR